MTLENPLKVNVAKQLLVYLAIELNFPKPKNKV